MQHPRNQRSFAKTLAGVGEGLFSENRTVLVNDADLMGAGAPVNAREKQRLIMIHDRIPPLLIGSAVMFCQLQYRRSAARTFYRAFITPLDQGACPEKALNDAEAKRAALNRVTRDLTQLDFTLNKSS